MSNSLQLHGLPGFSVHGIFQARILDQVVISYSRGSSWPKDWTRVSCVFCSGRWIHCANLSGFGKNSSARWWPLWPKEIEWSLPGKSRGWAFQTEGTIGAKAQRCQSQKCSTHCQWSWGTWIPGGDHTHTHTHTHTQSQFHYFEGNRTWKEK